MVSRKQIGRRTIRGKPARMPARNRRPKGEHHAADRLHQRYGLNWHACWTRIIAEIDAGRFERDEWSASILTVTLDEQRIRLVWNMTQRFIRTFLPLEAPDA